MKIKQCKNKRVKIEKNIYFNIHKHDNGKHFTCLEQKKVYIGNYYGEQTLGEQIDGQN